MGEPLQYFCLTCECACICAECVIHGEHRGHDVLKIREAAKQLPQRTGQLQSTGRPRAEELNGMVEDVKTEIRNIAIFVNNSRRELSSQFDMVKTGLAAEEKALMAEVQRCSSEVLEMLQVADQSSEGNVQEACKVLRHHHGNADAIASLNAFVKLNATLKVPPPSKDAAVSIADLKAHLQRGFDSRLSSIASLAEQIESLGKVEREYRKPRSPMPRSPMSPPQRGLFQDQAARSADSSTFSRKAFGSLTASQNNSVTSPGHERSPAMFPAPLLAGTAGKNGSKWAPPARFGNLSSPTEQQQEFTLQDPGHLESSVSRTSPRSPDDLRYTSPG